MNGTIYLLWFVPQRAGEDLEEDALLIGVYESEGLAKAAIERLHSKPGFGEHPAGFQIHSRELNEDSWTEGFIRD